MPGDAESEERGEDGEPDTLSAAEMLLERGYERPYLEALLTDEKLGVRTITTVREMMRLD